LMWPPENTTEEVVEILRREFGEEADHYCTFLSLEPIQRKFTLGIKK